MEIFKATFLRVIVTKT